MRIPNKVCIGITIEYFLNAKTRFQAQASQIDNYEYLIKKKKLYGRLHYTFMAKKAVN